MRIAPTILIALLVVTAGCSSLSGTEGDAATVAPGLDTTPTTTGAPAGESATTGYPPGVSPDADDEVDERALYVAHDRALEGQSVTWQQQHIWTNATGTVVYWWSETVWTNGSVQRYEQESGGENPSVATPSRTEYEFWTNGSVIVSRQVLPNGSVVHRVGEGGPPSTFATADSGRTILESALTGNELEYVGTEERANWTLHVLATTSTESRFTMRVTSVGVVRSFVLRTETEVDGEPVTVVRRFRTDDVGTTTIEKPMWAVNVTE